VCLLAKHNKGYYKAGSSHAKRNDACKSITKGSNKRNANEVTEDYAHSHYDRLGLEEQYMELLGVKIPMYTIPITPGRNLAVILEVAAMNNRQKKMGYNAAIEFTEQINNHFNQNMNQDL
jgi:serine kinase of HPr protein (carbohydrate metabolism regulator)